MLLSLQALRQAALERIVFIEHALAEFKLAARMGGEREFFPLARNGLPHPHLLDEAKMTAHLREHVPGIERVHKESITSAAQYELVTGPNPAMHGTGLRDASPLATAETLGAFNEGMHTNATRMGLGGVSFAARMRSPRIQASSGLHINSSLSDMSGTTNLFYEHGKATTDLQRHVTDALIRTHAEAAPAYLPSAASFERLGTHARGNPLNPAFWWEMSSGVPTRAGYMDNKGVTLGNVAHVVKGALGGRPAIGSIAGRHSNLLYKPLGWIEGMLFKGKRSVRIGFEQPHHYRLESRLAGADADAHVVIATEAGSILDAVRKYLRPRTPGLELDEATEKLIHAGDQQWIVRRHNSAHPSIPLPQNAREASERLVQSERSRELMGEDLFHGLVTYTRPPVHDAKLNGLYHGSQSHVERYLKGRNYERTPVAQRVHEALDSMPSPVQSDPLTVGWAGRVSKPSKPREL